MARLPQPGGDDGAWGQLLNDFLVVSHNNDGTIKAGAVDSTAIQDNSVSGAKLQNNSVTNAKLNVGSGSDGQVLTKASASAGGIAWTSVAGSPDAAPGTKGLVALNGDLSGTATSPTVPALANKADKTTTVSAGTGLTGGGDLSANRTLTVSYGTTAGTAAQGNDSRITGAEQTANKGVANGYASLNGSTHVPSAQLGSGTADTTTFLRGDGSWTAAPSAPVTSVAGKTGAVTLVEGDIANLTTDLAGKAPTTRLLTAGTGLTGGGDLSADRTFAVSFGTTAGTAAQGNDSRITGAEQTANKGVANGYASLNGSTHVPTAQLASGTADATTYLRGDSTWGAAVTSVAGRTGAVVIAESDVTNLTTDLAARTTVANGGGETYFDALNSGTAKTLDLANGNVQKLTLTGNCTITLTSPATGAYRSMLLYVFQDGTGSRTITWPASVKWGTAGAPTLTTTAGKMDKILLDTVDGGTTWYGTAGPGGF